MQMLAKLILVIGWFQRILKFSKLIKKVFCINFSSFCWGFNFLEKEHNFYFSIDWSSIVMNIKIS